jgi:hypothetical protein
MTEDKNPQPQERGFFSSLESAKKQRRAFHIPTAPAAAVRLVQNLNRKGASSTTVQTLPQAHPSIGKDSPVQRRIESNRQILQGLGRLGEMPRSRYAGSFRLP